MARFSALARVCVGLCGAWFTLWACAPPSVVAPMVPMGQGEGWNLGGAMTGGVQLTTYDTWDTGDVDVGAPQIVPAFGGQIWAVKERERVDLGATLGVLGSDGEGGPHLGMVVRPRLIERENLILGLDLQYGFLWGSIGVPVAVRASERAWIYTEPSVGSRYTGICHVPVGVSYKVTDEARLHAEVEYMMGATGYIEGPMVVGSVGVSIRP